MLAAYIVAAIVGGGMIVFSALAGLGAHVDVSHDMSHDVGHGDSPHGDSHAGHSDDQSSGAIWLPFFSVRFWTNAVATFGLLGTALTLAKASIEPLTSAIALGCGLAMGTVAAVIVRTMSRAERQSTVSEDDFSGALARVTVPISSSGPGKIRTQVKGDIIDLIAASENGAPIERGEEVFIIGIEGGTAKVARQQELLGE